jgi:CMP-N,N'-diacetyllegionaminic acid synthase
MKILITICARGGSKGIPKKNIRILNGRPLLDYTIRVARQFQSTFENVEIILSTDSIDIIRVANELKLHETYTRPEELAGDNAGKVETIHDVLLWHESEKKCKYDYILDLDVTSPLRNLVDLQNAFSKLQGDEFALNIISVSPANRNPYFNMVEKKSNGYYAQVKTPEEEIFTRQSTPIVFDLNASFYFYKREFFDHSFSGVITERSLVYQIPHICFDLDHLLDFEIMEYLMIADKLDFDL